MKRSKWNRYSAEFRAKVALETIRGEATISEIASRFGIHPTMVTQWKRQAARGMAEPIHLRLSIARQCLFLGISRSTFYYEATGESPRNLELMRVISNQSGSTWHSRQPT